MAARRGTSSNSRRIIHQVMNDNDVQPREIPHGAPFNPQKDNLQRISSSKRYFRTRGNARFNYHTQCRRKWTSARAWCIMDLKQQRIIHTFTQDCKTCKRSVPPHFDDEAIEDMAEYAVTTYLRRSGREEWPDRSDDEGSTEEDDDENKKPHDEERCDMCKRLGYRCC